MSFPERNKLVSSANNINERLLEQCIVQPHTTLIPLASVIDILADFLKMEQKS
jgi:hypothetical protein